jgi:hypothetical protein
MKFLMKIFPHIAIILSVMLITFYWVDRFNSAINIVNNAATKALLLALGIVSVINAIALIRFQRREQREKNAATDAVKKKERDL